MAQAGQERSYSAIDDLGQGGQGFYYYNDYRDDENSTEKPKKRAVRVSPQEKMQADMMQQLIKAVEKNTEVQEKILKKLEYAYPRTIPEYSTNKKTGEKCRSNSSADCFVMPVIAEAQNSVPVMKEMLRDPSMKNVKEYMRWQAAYFNQSFKVGNGFSLANEQYEREINNVDGMSHTNLPMYGDKQKGIGEIKKAAVVERLGEKLGLMIFVGKSKELEREYNGQEYTSLLGSVFGKMKNLTYVFYDEESRAAVEEKIARYKYTDMLAKYSKVRKIVAPEQFKRFKINASPAGVLIYKKEDGGVIWQKTGYSTLSPKSLMQTAYRFLRFHEIVPPGTINEKDGWEMADTLRKDGAFTKEQLRAISLDESKIEVTDDQYIIQPKKKKE